MVVVVGTAEDSRIVAVAVAGYSGSKSEDKKKAENKTYDYGNSLGAYGDYTYNKSTLDKYKDAKNDKPS